MMKALAVSLKPPKMRPAVRNSCPRPSVSRTSIAKPSSPVVLSATTFSRHCRHGTQTPEGVVPQSPVTQSSWWAGVTTLTVQ